MSEENRKVEEGADKAGEVVGKGVKKGIVAIKGFSKGLKKGVKGKGDVEKKD